MLRALHQLFGAYTATRFLTTGVVALLSLVYGGFTQLGLVPRYDSLPGLRAVDLFIMLYLFVALAFCVVWFLGPGGRAKRNHAQYMFRYVFRQSDQAGVRTFSAFALIVIAIGAYFLYAYGLYQRDALIFMIFVLGFPLLLDFLPQMPRRFVIPTNVESIDEILEVLGFEHDHPQRSNALSALDDYNREIGTPKMRERFWADPTVITAANSGLRIEIPPVVHQLVLDDQFVEESRQNDAPAIEQKAPQEIVSEGTHEPPPGADVAESDKPLWG